MASAPLKEGTKSDLKTSYTEEQQGHTHRVTPTVSHPHLQGHTHTYSVTPTPTGPHPHLQGHTHTYRATPTPTGPHPHLQGHTHTYRATPTPTYLIMMSPVRQSAQISRKALPSGTDSRCTITGYVCFLTEIQVEMKKASMSLGR